MSQYVVTDTELTAVADAIRSKGGTEADLEWPSAFVSAIGAITGGGGDGSAKNILSGTSDPTSNDGTDGDIYIKYDNSPVLVRYIKFTVNAVKSGGSFQLSDINFEDKNGNLFQYPAGTTGSSDATPGYWEGAYQDVSCLIDNNHDTKFYTSSFSAPSNIYIDLGSAALDLGTYNTWKWYTADDVSERDPISFSLSVSVDGITYVEIDSVSNASITSNRKAIAYSNCIQTGILSIFLKVNGSWVDIIGKDIDDVNTEGSGGSTNILSGTDTPTSSVGNDGSIYLQYGGAQVAGGYADKAYVVTSTSQRLSTHSASFYKTIEGGAIAVEAILGSWHCPVLISDVADYVKYTNNTSPTAVVVDGVTWYSSGGEYANSSDDDPTIPTLVLPDTSSWHNETNVRAILQAAHYKSSVFHTITSAKLKVNGVWGDLIGNDIEDVDLGSPSGLQVLTRAQWNTLTRVQKQAYSLVAIQDTSSGFDRGELVNGADYIGSMIQSGSGSDSVTFTVNRSGNYQLFVLALNSEASSYDLNIGVTQNGTSVTGQTLDTNNYTNSGSNRRNYRINVYDIECDSGDELSISVTNRSSYSRVVYALCDTNITTLDQAMTTPDGPTSGSYNDEAIVLYGTCDGVSSTQTINFGAINANDTVSTEHPGSNYKSSYIFWLS